MVNEEQSLLRQKAIIDFGWTKMMENSLDHIILMDLDLNILKINYTVPSLTRDQVIGKSVLDFIPEEYHAETIRNIDNAKKKGESSSFTLKYIDHNRREFYFLTRIVPVFNDNELIALSNISSDITERKRSGNKAFRQ